MPNYILETGFGMVYAKLKNKEESIPIQDVLRIARYKISVFGFRDSSVMPVRNCGTTSRKGLQEQAGVYLWKAFFRPRLYCAGKFCFW